jgi:protein phosphatase
VRWPNVHLLHVGDSRFYVVRRSTLEQLTVDHTLAQRLRDMGVGDSETARRSPWRNTLWNVVGGRDPALDPQVLSFELRWGDALLLATDGLTDPLPESEILHRVHEERRAEDVCASLIRAARDHGATDDMTVLYAQFGRASFWKRLREILMGS